jgi:hypothetical protein
MRQLERAMFAMFLLAMLADGSRLCALTPVAGEAAGQLILSAAPQFGSGTRPAAVLVAVRRADGSLAPIARWKRSDASLAQWSRLMAAHSRFAGVSPLLMTTGSVFRLWAGMDAEPSIPLEPAASSLAIFEHNGSPAP